MDHLYSLDLATAKTMSLAGVHRAMTFEQSLPLDRWPLIDIFHAINVARDYERNAQPQPFLQRFIAYFLTATGGGMLSSILLGQPAGFFFSDRVLCWYLLVGLLAFTPLTRRLFRCLTELPLLATFISMMDDVSWVTSVVGGMNKALQPMHASATAVKNSVAAAIVCGILQGCGGGFIRSTFNMNDRIWHVATPKQLTGYHFVFYFTSLMSIMLYVFVNPHSLLTLPAKRGPPLSMGEARWFLIVAALVANTGSDTMMTMARKLLRSKKGKSKKSVAVLSATTNGYNGSGSGSGKGKGQGQGKEQVAGEDAWMDSDPHQQSGQGKKKNKKKNKKND